VAYPAATGAFQAIVAAKMVAELREPSLRRCAVVMPEPLWVGYKQGKGLSCQPLSLLRLEFACSADIPS
jgi:hypothetical protein